MRYRNRLARLERQLLTRAALPPFVVHVEHTDGTITTTTILMRSA